MQILRVLLFDRHEIVRMGLRALLEPQRGVQVVGEAADTATAVSLAANLQPDVVIADLAPGTAVSVIGQLRAVCPRVRVVVLTESTESGEVRSALDAGVVAYALKQSPATIVRDVMDAVSQHRHFLDPQLGSIRQGRDLLTSVPLSEREREVVGLVARGYSSREIAVQVNVSVKTIETYRSRAVEKLGLRHRSDLVRYAIDRGWHAQHDAA